MSHERHEPARHADHKGHSPPQAPSGGDGSPASPTAHARHGDGLRTEHIPLSDLYCACCAEEIAPALKANPHVVKAKLDWQNDAIEVIYHAAMISREEIEKLIRATSCCSIPTAGQSASTMHLAHSAQMAPVTMGAGDGGEPAAEDTGGGQPEVGVGGDGHPGGEWEGDPGGCGRWRE